MISVDQKAADTISSGHGAAARTCLFIARGVGLAGLAVGGLVLAGWMLDIGLVMGTPAGILVMKPNSALCFVLLGASLWLLVPPSGSLSVPSRTRQRAVLILSALVILLALAALLTNLLGLPVEIDNFLFREKLAASDQAYAGRISTPTALGFLLLGLALVLRQTRGRMAHRTAELLGLAAALIGFVALLGYLYSVPAFYYTSAYASMGVHTALLFVGFGTALLLRRPDSALMSMLGSPHSGGILFRRMLPLAILLPIGIGWLRLSGERAGWYGTEVGVALMVATTALLFGALLWLSARSLNKAHGQQYGAEERALQLTRALDDFSDAVIGLDLDANITSWGAGATRLTGYEEREAIGRRMTDLLIPAARAEERAAVLQHVRRDEPYISEGQRTTKDGRLLEVEVSFMPMHDTSGALIGQLTLTRDRTERRRADSALAAERTLLRTLIDALPDIVFTKDTAGRFNMCNVAELKHIGVHSPEELLGKTVFDLYPRELAQLYHADDEQALAGHPILDREELSVDVEGKQRWHLTIKMPLRNVDGDIVGLVGVSRDITQRRTMEEALRESERRFRQLAESLPQLVWTCESDGRCDFLSRQWVEYTGIPAGDQLGSRWLEQVHPGDRTALMHAWGHAVAEGSSFQLEFRIRKYDGTYRWFDTRAVPLFDNNRRIVKWVGCNTDVNEAREMRETLREHARLLDLAPVLVHELDGHILFWSQGAEALYGYTKQEAIGKLAHELLHSELPQPRAAIDETLRRTGSWEGELKHRTREGDTRVVKSQWTLHFDAEGRPSRILEVNADITEGKQAEAKLRNEERRFRALIEHGTDSVAVIDEHNNIQYLSPASVAVEGYTPEELIGRNGLENTHPDDLPLVDEIVQQLIANPGKPIPVLWRRRHKDGRWLWLEGVATNLLHDPAVRGIVTNYRDVTERRRAAEQQLTSQKMEALGTLAGGIAHDFNNILLAIAGNAKLAISDLPPDHPAQISLAEIQKAGVRAADLVRRILAFSAPAGAADGGAAAARRSSKKSLKLLRSTLPAMIEIRARFEPTICRRSPPMQRRFTRWCSTWRPTPRTRSATSRGVIEADLEAITVSGNAAILTHESKTRPLRALIAVRQRLRHGQGNAGAHLRSVLHHQAGRHGHRAWACRPCTAS